MYPQFYHDASTFMLIYNFFYCQQISIKIQFSHKARHFICFIQSGLTTKNPLRLDEYVSG